MHAAWGRLTKGLARFRAAVWTVLLGTAIALAYLSGAFVPADRALSDLGFSLFAHRAGNDITLVEIDSRSLERLNSWPWSRAFHAALIQRLATTSADTIAFDVDFSAASAPAGDAALAQAIQAADRKVILAAFAQVANRPDGTVLSHSAPLAAFAEHARIGLVNVFADADGRPRRYRLVEDRLPDRPMTMAAVLAAPKGAALVGSQANEFAIDYGIDPQSIARLSYVDVLTGNFDPKLVAGRKILVGATALELGDRFSVPARGLLAGVEIQALAYETLALGRAIHPAGALWTLAGLLVITALACWSSGRSWRLTLGLALGETALVLGLGFLLQGAFAVSLETAPWLAAVVAGMLQALIREAERLGRVALQMRSSAARQTALMEVVFKDSFDGIVIVGADRKIALANAAAGRLLDRDPQQLLGRYATEVLPGVPLEPLEGPPVRELAVKDAAGRDLALAIAVSRSHGGESQGADGGEVWIVTFRDESARRAIEVAREQTLRELKAATTAKDEFLARISHELRTPLSAIIGFSTIIAEQRSGPIGNLKYAEYAADIHSGGIRLLDLVNNIIDIAKIEAEKYQIRPDAFELRSLLAGCVARARESEPCGDRSLRFEAAPGLEAMRADRQALGKVIDKLLSNAVKFTGPSGSIVLRAVPGPDHGVIIAVEDDGIGIADSELKNVVAAFTQVKGGLDRRHEGSGLGLYFANRMMLLLGGTLQIASSPGHGTTVQLLLPGTAIETSAAA